MVVVILGLMKKTVDKSEVEIDTIMNALMMIEEDTTIIEETIDSIDRKEAATTTKTGIEIDLTTTATIKTDPSKNLDQKFIWLRSSIQKHSFFRTPPSLASSSSKS